jgi:hypothetical protein
MNNLIQSELRQVLADWTHGQPIRSIELGHPVRVNPKTGAEERHTFRQTQVHDYCFTLLSECVDYGQPMPWELFSMLDIAPPDLSLEERQAAESLAWKAQLRGWNNAISGFDGHITLTREADA